MSSIPMTAGPVTQQRDAFLERFYGFISGTFNIFSIYIGDRLGLYRALIESEHATPGELAARTHTHPRYVREWLEQQTVAGILEVEDERADAEQRRYRVPPGHAEPLIQCESLNYVAPLAQLLAGVVRPLPEILNAYRNGGGVPFSSYGIDMREGQAASNYPAFANQLASEWLPSMPDVVERLNADPPARVADIGCGFGWSSIAIAKAFPKVHVDGYDLDQPSISRALSNAQRNQVSDRVSFQARDAGEPALAGKYDLVTAFECIHDMSDPVGVLSKMRALAGEGGTVMVADERVGDIFTAAGAENDWMMYGFSILHCLPAGMTEDHSAGTGTVMRTSTFQQYAENAGFQKVEVLPVDHPTFRLYRLHH